MHHLGTQWDQVSQPAPRCATVTNGPPKHRNQQHASCPRSGLVAGHCLGGFTPCSGCVLSGAAPWKASSRQQVASQRHAVRRTLRSSGRSFRPPAGCRPSCGRSSLQKVQNAKLSACGSMVQKVRNSWHAIGHSWVVELGCVSCRSGSELQSNLVQHQSARDSRRTLCEAGLAACRRAEHR